MCGQIEGIDALVNLETLNLENRIAKIEGLDHLAARGIVPHLHCCGILGSRYLKEENEGFYLANFNFPFMKD